MRLPAFMSKAVGNVKLGASSKAPEIALIFGAINIVGCVVSACKGTLKFQEALKTHNENIELLKKIEAKQQEGTATEAEKSIDVAKTRKTSYFVLGIEAAKDFGPAIGFAAVGGTSVAIGFKIIKSRYIAVSGALAQSLKETRLLERNIEKQYGYEKLMELKGLKLDNVVEERTDPETGEVTYETTKKVSGPKPQFLFSVFFDEAHHRWSKNAWENQNFLYAKHAWANHVLDNVGHLTANELLDILEYDEEYKTPEGQIYGWTKYKTDEEARAHGAANKIDFGCFGPGSKLFTYNNADTVLLNFNVDPTPITETAFTRHAIRRDPAKERRRAA